MKMTRLSLISIRRVLGTLAILVVVLTVASCTSLLGDFNSTSGGAPDATAGGGGGDGAIVNPGGKAIGATCAANGECAMNFCTDGVCCGTACDGVCEKCDLPGTPGQCMPVAMNTDPDMECVAVPIAAPDGGTEAGVADAANDGAANAAVDGAADGATVDAAVADAGVGDGGLAVAFDAGQPDLGYNPPDGGIMQTPLACAGTCNGQRACAYPSSTKTCGTQFCNTSSQQAGLACDGAGHCTLGFSDCKNYSCENGGCGTSCTGPADCLPTSFCNGSGVCQPKKQDSVTCGASTECTSGFCEPTAVGNVCCNTDCTKVPGGDCGKPGSVGECKCQVDCGDGGACQLFYLDSDGDGYGNAASTMVGCSGAPPLHYVADNTDCDDNNANAHPGQTGYFASPRSNGSYDYDCDGKEVGTNAVYPGATCGLCGGSGCTDNPSCASGSTSQSYLTCVGYGVIFCQVCVIGVAEVTVGGTSQTQAAPIATVGPIQQQTCRGGATQGFTGTAACGAAAAYTYCEIGCNGADYYGYASSSAFPCH
jgi:hypothetical protein